MSELAPPAEMSAAPSTVQKRSSSLYSFPHCGQVRAKFSETGRREDEKTSGRVVWGGSPIA